MNKLSLAIVSAAFFFSCSADGPLNSSNTPPEWDKKNIYQPDEKSDKYCLIEDYYYSTECVLIEGFTAEECREEGGSVVDSCPE